jgi:hypothetical protein
MVEKIAAGELLEISNRNRVFLIGTHLTQRAADGWDSARFLGFFLNFGISPFPNFFPPSRR